MKLLFGIKALDAPGGGAERVLATVGSGLARRGHDVAALTFDAPGGESFYPLDAAVRRICLDIGPADRPVGPRAFLRRLPALRRSLGDERPDVAVGFMHSMFVPLTFVAASLGIPVVASEHTVPRYYRSRRLEYALAAAACLLADRVTVLSPTIRALYPAPVRRRMVAIPNPVRTAANAVADPAGGEGTERRILSVGRLDADKDHATLVEAFARVAGRFPDWRLRIVGDGPLRDDLERRVRRLELSERVSFPGMRTDVETEYARAQLYVVPSRVESFGLATAEALAAGLPVAGFADCPGTRELVRHDVNGWLVRDSGAGGRVAALAAVLDTLLSDADLRRRLGAGGPPGVRAFETEAVVDRWRDLLAETAGIK